MKIHFYSIAKDSKIDYITEASVEGNTYIFSDKALENTVNMLTINDGFIELTRKGDVCSSMRFKLGRRTMASYSNNLGLAFDFVVYTRRLEVTNSKITIEYDFFIDSSYQDTVKIYVLLK